MEELTARLAELVGRAEGADGAVRVGHGSTGLRELVIDPKAMRLPAAELSSTITTALAAAEADFRQQAQQALVDTDLVPSEQSRRERVAAVQAQLAEAQQQYSASIRAAAQRIDEATRAGRPPA
jgi:multidrug efflux pump subunit AcrA (membrane-fusion protein)